MKLTITCIFTALAFASFGQTGSATVDVFAPSKTEAFFSTEDVSKDLKNCVKWNLGMLTRGTFMFDYERSVTDFMTVEGGIGLTYRDYVFEAFDDNSEVYSLDEGRRSPKGGLALETSLKFYPGQLGNFEGLYFSPTVRYRNYNFDMKQIADLGYSNVNLGYNFTEFGLVLGNQGEDWVDLVTLEYYCGVVYRTGNKTYYDISQSKSITEKLSAPLLVFGVRIGVPF